MQTDATRWRRSYKYVPWAAGEEEIANSQTGELRAAYRLMQSCKIRPPRYEFQAANLEILSLASEGTLLPYFEKSILDESLRYARVSRELARRVESENPELALSLLQAAILPGASALAFERHDAYSEWWDRAKQKADEAWAKVEKLAGEIKNLTGLTGGNDDDHKLDVVRTWASALFEDAFVHGLLKAAFAISERQDAWNLCIKASMVALADRVGPPEDASRLENECLDLLGDLLHTNRLLGTHNGLGMNLWDEVFGVVSKSVVPPAVPLAPTPPAAKEIETVLSRVLDSKLGPLLRSMTENVKVSHALQDRLDFIVEKLIDLDQRSELTWQQISQSARQEPEYEEATRDIEASLKERLGDMWRRLTPGSSEDLVDAEYIYKHCCQRGRGWRMAALGYCTTAERELQASYRTVRDQLVPASAAETATVQTLGDLIQSVEGLGARRPKSKPAPSGLGALLSSVDELWRLNSVRKKATHPKGISKDEVTWVRQTLLGNKSAALLATILAVRVNQ